MRLKSYLLLLLTTSFCYVMSYAQENVVAQTQDSISNVSKIQRGTRANPLGDRTESAIRLKNRMDSKVEIFYSNAPMYVDKTTDQIGTTMLILGTAKFDNAAEISQHGQTDLTGDFVLLKQVTGVPATEPKPLFGLPATGTNTDPGIINFIGSWNKQSIIREDINGNRLGDSHKISGTVAYFPTIIVYKEYLERGVDGVYILPFLDPGELAEGIAVAPIYDIEKEGFVSVASNMAMGVKSLNISGGNRFSVEAITGGLDKARIANPTKEIKDLVIGDLTASVHEFYKVNPAYVDIRETKDGFDGNARLSGFSELDLKLYAYDSGVDNVETGVDALLGKTNQFPVTGITTISGNGNKNATFLRGFSSPFSDLRADYMFYHVLTQPRGSAPTGAEGPIGDPKTKFEPGLGFFYAMDLSRAYFDKIASIWGNVGGDRSRGGYKFSRLINEMNGGSNFNLYSPTVFGDEGFQRFNTDKVNVAIYGTIEQAGKGQGINALGNPYMTPITLNGILGEYNGSSITGPGLGDYATPFDVYGAEGVKAVHDLKNANLVPGTAIIRPSVWIPTSGMIAHINNFGVAAYSYNLKYDYMDVGRRGATLDPNKNYFLEPMQMFMIQVAQSGTFTFTDKMKTFVGEPFPAVIGESVSTRSSFTKSSSVEDKSLIDGIIPDWFIIEAVSDKGGAITADRTAVRFFTTANEANPSAEHDVAKNILKPIDKKSIPASVKASLKSGIASDAEEVLTPSNVLYTVDTQGTPLLSNGLGYRTKEVPLYYIAGPEEEYVTLRFYGVENFEGVKEAWLVDNFLGVEEKLDREGIEYPFVAKPGTENAESGNRFTLRFYKDGDEPTLTENPITCYYSGSTLHIGGLNEDDLGSTVQIFDLQGRLMGNTTVNIFPNMEYRKPLGQGTFIVRISGKRSFTTKFVNIQNY